MRSLFQGLLTPQEPQQYGPQVPDAQRWQYNMPQRQVGFLDPQNAGTMALIGSLLQASGPQQQKQSLGQITGQAIGAYGQGKAAQDKMRADLEAQQIDNYTKRALMNLKEREFNEISASDAKKYELEQQKINKLIGKSGTGGTALLKEMEAFGIDPMSATPEQIAYFQSIKRGGVIPAGYVVNNAGQLTAIPGAQEGFQKVEEAKKYGGAAGKESAERQSSVTAIGEQLPELQRVVGELKDLAGKATYTKAGKLTDVAAKEILGKTTEGSLAKADYEAKIRLALLPTLRATFGAQFTQKEGESLLETMGSGNYTPQEKQAILESFIQSKMEQSKVNVKRPGAAAQSQANNVPSGWNVRVK